MGMTLWKWNRVIHYSHHIALSLCDFKLATNVILQRLKKTFLNISTKLLHIWARILKKWTSVPVSFCSVLNKSVCNEFRAITCIYYIPNMTTCTSMFFFVIKPNNDFVAGKYLFFLYVPVELFNKCIRFLYEIFFFCEKF